MRKVLSSWFNRQVNIINYLISSKHSVNIAALAKDLNTSERLIRKDIERINANIAPDLFEIEINQSAILLKFEPNKCIKDIHYRLFENTPEYLLIEFIFFNDRCALEDLCEELHLSSATLYRKINTLNKVLKSEYDFKIDTSPFRLVGNEVNIRHFIAQLISEKYSRETWPFPIIDEAKISKFIHECLLVFEVPIDFAVIQKIKLLISVGIIRNHDGYYIKSRSIDDDKVTKLMDYILSEPEMTSLWKYLFKVSLSRDLLIDIFSCYAQKGVVFSKEALINLAINDPAINHSYMRISLLLAELSDQFSIPIEDKDQLILTIHITLYFEKFEIYSDYLFFESGLPLLDYLRKQMPDFYHYSKNSLSEMILAERKNVNSSFLRHMLYTLLVHWENLHQFFFKPIDTVEVLLISDIDVYHAKMTKHILKNHFNNRLKIRLINDQIENLSQINNELEPIVISNFPIHNLENKHLVLINDVIQPSDIKYLSNLIKEISQSA